ncbi:MAG: potassium channel protein [Desulfobacterium sp.]|nr:potassium channel protein [Desulfobacterium sp.]
MNRLRQIIIAAVVSLAVSIMGTVGYMIIEGWNFLDSFYMVALTLSTVGYSEVHPISPGGRVFTIILIITSVSLVLYLAGVIVQFVVEGEIRSILGRRKLDKRIAKLKNHYIVCGYGRIGRILCKQLAEQTPDIAVLENCTALEPTLTQDNMLYLMGDASDETLLLKAGIRQASHLIAALATDVDNVFLVLTARQLNPKIHIMARAEKKAAKSKLYAAGADQVDSPYDIGAVSMGLRLLRPSVSYFLNIALTRKEKAIQIEEAPISPDSSLVNIMLKDSGIRQKYNLIIIAIKKADGEMIFNPSFDTYMEEGDTIISMGRARDLKRFHQALDPK